MNEKVSILGVKFDNLRFDEAVEKSINMLDADGANIIYTANPEIVMAARKDEEFFNIINSGDLVVADGIGVVIGSKIIKKPLYERIAGYDLVQNIFDKIKETDKTVYLFGAAPLVIEAAAIKMKKKHEGLKIVGTHNGYFKEEEEQAIIEEINAVSPSLLLVGLGAPRQEKWIYKYKNELNVKLIIGVGGSFDVMSERVKRAPKVFIKLGLEWFYRLITQPTRFVRMLQLPLFLIEVIFKGKKSH
jgi:N-acetylglucosaminyldiphosphoundecaprenol N-acetyl-beta-D-mannosaminyltransferase